MEYTGLNQFSFLILLAGGILLTTGLFYKFNQPKTVKWYGGMQLKSALRSRETYQEAVRFAAKPYAFAGLILIIVGLLSIFFKFTFFNLVLANILIMSISILLISLINQHINGLFEK